jgi:hypothetical protein
LEAGIIRQSSVHLTCWDHYHCVDMIFKFLVVTGFSSACFGCNFVCNNVYQMTLQFLVHFVNDTIYNVVSLLYLDLYFGIQYYVFFIFCADFLFHSSTEKRVLLTCFLEC